MKTNCDCGGEMKHYDCVKRVVKGRSNSRDFTTIERKKCTVCGRVKRIIPTFLYPHKHYGVEIINGVIDGLITPETLGFEDYPCEITMKRWKKSTDLVFTK